MLPFGSLGSGFSKDCSLTETSAGLGGGAGNNDWSRGGSGDIL